MAKEFIRDDRVRVISDNYKGRTVGCLGTVYTAFKGGYCGDQIAVIIDDMPNNRSKYLCHYYTSKQLELVEGDSIMNGNNVMQGNFRVAFVQFLEGTNNDKIYKYALYDGTDAKVDDICVARSANHGYGLVRIVDIQPKTDEPIIREIVCKADFTAYLERVETRKRKAELMLKMKKRASELQELLLYQSLAAADPEMAELLSDYTTIDGGADNAKCKEV